MRVTTVYVSLVSLFLPLPFRPTDPDTLLTARGGSSGTGGLGLATSSSYGSGSLGPLGLGLSSWANEGASGNG